MLQRLDPAPRSRVRPVWLVLLAAGMIVGIAMGLRQVMGLYLKPITTDLNLGREPFSLAMAIANLVWGLAAIPMGAIADRYGAGRVLIVGTLTTMAGIYLLYAAVTETDLLVSGVLIGIGVGGTGITALVGAVSRAVPPEKRPQAIASLGMASGIGTFLAFPYIHLFMEMLGWKGSLLVTIATLAVLLPLSIPLIGKPTQSADVLKSQTLGEAVGEAVRHPSFWLLTFGFFVCGFHVAFYSVHLPAFVADKGMPGTVAVTALTAVGIANIAGTFLSGQSTKYFPKRFGLSFIYTMRCLAFLSLLYLPITPVSIVAISTLLGLFWLSTVPLTSSLVATFFGPQWMSMLFGFVFLSHQIGSFTGLWLAGVLYDQTKSYDIMWWISIGLALFAAIVHLPIRERPVARLLGDAIARIRVEITPHVIDLGNRVIRLSSVTSVGVGAAHPLRPLGLVLLGATFAFVGHATLAEAGTQPLQAPKLPPVELALVCASAALGLVMTLVSRRQVVIRMVDGGSTSLSSPDRQAAVALIGRIGEAMEAASSARPPAALIDASTPHQQAPGGHPTATAAPARQLPMTRPASAPIAEQPRPPAALAAVHHLGIVIERADIAHKAALLDLLAVVEAHVLGRAPRADAIAHWQSLATYTRQYLAHVPGLAAAVDHVERQL